MKITRHIFDTYLSFVEGSVGTDMFRHFWASIDGVRTDTAQDGWTSCALHVSCILTIFKVVNAPHTTVASVVSDLLESGWQKVEIPEPGDVLIYEPVRATPEDEPMDHIGFYVGNDKAVSTSWRERRPILHDWTFRDRTPRSVTAIYRGRHLFHDSDKEV